MEDIHSIMSVIWNNRPYKHNGNLALLKDMASATKRDDATKD